MKGFARCEYFDCGAAAVVGIKLEGVIDGGTEQEIVLHYSSPCYEIVRANELRSTSIYAELREQGCSEKMANHVMLARTERTQ